MNKGKIELLGIGINNQTKKEIIAAVQQDLKAGKKIFIITPYPEFFYMAFNDFRLREVFNKADYALADGIGTLWAAHYLNLKLRSKNYYAKIIEALLQMLLTGMLLIFNRRKISDIIPEKITGADFFWDLAQIAQKEELSIFLLGGKKSVAAGVAKKLQQRFMGLKIAGYSSADSHDPEVIDQINRSGTDLLMVAFGPAKQEKWIEQHWQDLNIKLAIGVGGTFDYISGHKLAPPKFIRETGLEWLFRLLTQPTRFKRIWHATFSFVQGVIRHKVFISTPYRENAVAVIINAQGEILIAKRTPWASAENPGPWPDHWQFPQGGIDPNEPEDRAVLREVREEIGTTQVKILGKSKQKNVYTWNLTTRRLWFNKFKFRGQEQNIFYLKYLGDESDIKLDHEELVEYKWVVPEQLMQSLFPLRKNIAAIVLSEINKYLDV